MPFKSPCEPYRLFKNSGPNPSKMTMESLQPTKFHASNSPKNQLRPLKNKGLTLFFAGFWIGSPNNPVTWEHMILRVYNFTQFFLLTPIWWSNLFLFVHGFSGIHQKRISSYSPWKITILPQKERQKKRLPAKWNFHFTNLDFPKNTGDFSLPKSYLLVACEVVWGHHKCWYTKPPWRGYYDHHYHHVHAPTRAPEVKRFHEKKHEFLVHEKGPSSDLALIKKVNLNILR